MAEPRRGAFAVGGENSRMRLVLALCAACLVAGCGTPEEFSKQAEDVQSVAAEGALLAGTQRLRRRKLSEWVEGRVQKVTGATSLAERSVVRWQPRVT